MLRLFWTSWKWSWTDFKRSNYMTVFWNMNIIICLNFIACVAWFFFNHFYGISYFRCIGNLFMYTSFLYCKNLCWITIRTFTQIKSSVVGMFYLQSMTYIKYWIGSVKFSFRPLQENTVLWVTRFGTRITYFKDVLFHS